MKPTLLLAAALLLAAPAFAADDFSAAERAIFMTNQLANVKPPATLRYRYVKSGSLEDGFEDKAAVTLKPRADRSCCSAEAEFLSGARKLSLPEVEAAEGNPVVLYFLERDIREMNRMTKGQSAYFRKRIRMAIYNGAQARDVTVPYAGKTVRAREFTIAPYLDDPLKERFAKLSGKRYTFTLSDAVPGGVYSISARVEGEPLGTPVVLSEEITIEGAGPR